MNRVVVMPYPGRGHINPLLNLCHLLSSRFCHQDIATVFTVVVTEEWLELIGSDPKPQNVRFATIPNVIPSEINRGSDTLGFFVAVQTEMETPFDRLLDRMELPVNLIIADVTLRWTLDVANRRKIPVASYWPMSASMFTMWYHFFLIQKHQHTYADLSGGGDEYVDFIPGLSPIKVADLPWIDQRMHDLSPDLSSLSKKAQSLILTTVYELEHEAVDAIKGKLQIPIYVFGPNIPNSRLQRPSLPSDESNYFSWLSSKPPSSVLYISLGSFLSVPSAQMDEISAGLKQSGVNFLWVARGEASRLSRCCGGNGLVVEWCNQLRVLLHSAVGGFLSHCGWNSTKECVFSGVPMLTFPIAGDQILNSKMIVEDWKNGWKLRMGSLVKREHISVVIKRFMASESDEQKEMMRRVKKLESTCRESIAEGGSATRDIDYFIKDNFASPQR